MVQKPKKTAWYKLSSHAQIILPFILKTLLNNLLGKDGKRTENVHVQVYVDELTCKQPWQETIYLMPSHLHHVQVVRANIYMYMYMYLYVAKHVSFQWWVANKSSPVILPAHLAHILFWDYIITNTQLLSSSFLASNSGTVWSMKSTTAVPYTLQEVHFVQKTYTCSYSTAPATERQSKHVLCSICPKESYMVHYRISVLTSRRPSVQLHCMLQQPAQMDGLESSVLLVLCTCTCVHTL